MSVRSNIKRAPKRNKFQMSVNNGWIIKKELSYRRLLFSYKQKQRTDTCFNRQSPGSPLSERSHVVYGYVYMNCPEQAIAYGSFVTDMGQRGEKDGKSLSLEVTVVLKLNILKKMDKLYNSMCFMVSEFYLKNEKYLR